MLLVTVVSRKVHRHVTPLVTQSWLNVENRVDNLPNCLIVRTLLSKRSVLAVDSATTSADEALIENVKLADRSQKQTNSRFPWRHESNYLPRLVSGTLEFSNDTVFPKFTQNIMAFLFLEMPLWRFFILNRGWRNQLADACAYSFAQGVAGILSNLYSIRLDDLIVSENSSDGEKLRFVYCPDKVQNSSDTGNVSDSLREEDSSVFMLSAPLRKLFQSAYENGKDRFQIHLETVPVKAALFNIVAWPYVDRASLERDPTIQDLIIKSFSRENLFNDLNELLRRSMGNMSEKQRTTVEIQVLVECLERFQVRDRHSGLIVQGTQDCSVQSVVHLVRLEREIETSPGSLFSHRPGNWQITDIDDLVTTKPLFRIFPLKTNL